MPLFLLLGCTGDGPDLTALDDAIGAVAPVTFAAQRLVAALDGDDACTDVVTGDDGAIGTVETSEACPVPAVGGHAELVATGLVVDQGGQVAVAFPPANPYRVSEAEGVILRGGAAGPSTVVFVDAALALDDGAVGLGESGLVVEVERGEAGPTDDRYVVTGGAQVVLADGAAAAADTVQLVLVDVVLDAACTANPVAGSATLQMTSSGDGLGAVEDVQVQFHAACDGRADLVAVVGVHAGVSGTTAVLRPLRE